MTTLKLYPLYHALCGEIAFYTTKILTEGDMILPCDFLLPDGNQPKKYDTITCGNCHNSTMDGFYSMPFSYKDDQPVEVTFDQVKT